MTETTPRDLFIAFIIFTMFIVGGISLINMFNTHYAGFADSEQLREFKQFNKTADLISTTSTFNNSISQLTDALDEDNPFYRTFGIVGALFQGAWGMISGLLVSFNFMLLAISNLKMFGVPAWFIGLGSLLLTSLIIFTILSVIFNRKT